MEIEKLIKKLNNGVLPEGYKALVGGSVVLKTMGLINRNPEDVDIIIANNDFMSTERELADKMLLIENSIKALFPFETPVHIGFTKYTGNEKIKNNFFSNFYMPAANSYIFSHQIHSINFLIHNDFSSEDYYSPFKINGISCVSVKEILRAKKNYNRPKDLMDFHEMQKLMFF